MLNEFRVGECKADLAILNGTAKVYELKSERDSLSRLERQVTTYANVFAQVNVIAAESHIDAVIASVPGDVGILLLNGRQQIRTLRKPADRPERTSPTAIFDSIRTNEARMILSSQGVSVPRVPNTELNDVLRQLFVKLDPCTAHEGMVRVLKKTRNLLPLSHLVAQLPHSLKPRPVVPQAAAIDYTPSQYLCEFIKKCGYNGVVYLSSVIEGGDQLGAL